MKLLTFSLIASVSLAFFSCANENKTDISTETDSLNTTTTDTSGPMTMDTASVPMVNHAQAALSGTYSDTMVNGKAEFHADAQTKVKMTLEITIPKKANKTVAVHIHEHGDCGDTATLAHGHWNPTNEQHGKWGSGAYHSGDIGNIKLDGKGKGTITIETDRWTLGGTAAKNILSKSIIVHGGADDYKSQPSGNSGTRIGCGVIQ